ncbi:energy transducer TonB [Sphingobium cloacae]|uniref:Protein TonB n=1 Tax=Sphingobium cloacae TaxID=120107 RepID=A0A1E1F3P4_9SPHN|nr:energy transducer TonB [Sphingobium cloacae]BAV65127.1 ferric siderophore transport system, periplasmic binding protein TonB [Sphingobium cloacae]
MSAMTVRTVGRTAGGAGLRGLWSKVSAGGGGALPDYRGDAGYRGGRRSPAGIGGAIMVHAVVVGAILLMPKELIEPFVPTTLIGTNIPLTPPPPEATPPQKEEIKPTRPAIDRSTAPETIIPPRGANDMVTGTEGPMQVDGGAQDGGSVIRPIDPPPLPLFVDAAVDPRALAAFQPDYPGTMIRQGLEGSVKVRVTIDAKGRVTDIERLSASDDAFWLATQRHALRKWRFVPATRDGVAVPSSKVLTVHFRLRDN